MPPRYRRAASPQRSDPGWPCPPWHRGRRSASRTPWPPGTTAAAASRSCPTRPPPPRRRAGTGPPRARQATAARRPGGPLRRDRPTPEPRRAHRPRLGPALQVLEGVDADEVRKLGRHVAGGIVEGHPAVGGDEVPDRVVAGDQRLHDAPAAGGGLRGQLDLHRDDVTARVVDLRLG